MYSEAQHTLLEAPVALQQTMLKSKARDLKRRSYCPTLIHLCLSKNARFVDPRVWWMEFR